MADSHSDVNKDEVTVGLWLTMFPLAPSVVSSLERKLTELLQHRGWRVQENMKLIPNTQTIVTMNSLAQCALVAIHLRTP